VTALRGKWSVRVEGLETRLAVGLSDAEREPRPVRVSLLIDGLAPDTPGGLADCIDYAPICDWITEHWPQSAHTPLLETRVNELLAFVFAFDKRVQDVWVGLYRPLDASPAARVGIERQSTRRRFEEQMHSLDLRARAGSRPDLARAASAKE
jgi:dihydroneopterin aldolase